MTEQLSNWLNVGSGAAGSGLQPLGFLPANWREFRLDADSAVDPDFVTPAHDLSAVADVSMDAVFSSHCIEHLYLDQAVPALTEWRRVLKLASPSERSEADWDFILRFGFLPNSGAIRLKNWHLANRPHSR